jgi:hypothetical protein
MPDRNNGSLQDVEREIGQILTRVAGEPAGHGPEPEDLEELRARLTELRQERQDLLDTV